MRGSSTQASLAIALAAIVTPACTSDEWPPLTLAEQTDDGGDDGASIDPELAASHLEVFEPAGASIHIIGQPMPLSAQLRDEDGFALDFDDIRWRIAPDLADIPVGADGSVVLPPGIYDVTAVAVLPNGDRLETQVADVRVQSRWTGDYFGDAAVLVTDGGNPVGPACRGKFGMHVGIDGQTLTMDGGTCRWDAGGMEVTATYVLAGELSATGTGEGEIAFDFGTYGNAVLPFSGAFTETGFAAAFEGDADLSDFGSVELQGALFADLVDPYVDPE